MTRGKSLIDVYQRRTFGTAIFFGELGAFSSTSDDFSCDAALAFIARRKLEESTKGCRLPATWTPGHCKAKEEYKGRSATLCLQNKMLDTGCCTNEIDQ